MSVWKSDETLLSISSGDETLRLMFDILLPHQLSIVFSAEALLVAGHTT